MNIITRNGLLLIVVTLLAFMRESVFADTQRQEISRKVRYECKCQQKYQQKPKKGYIQCAKHKYRYYERPYCKNCCFAANKSYHYTPYYDPSYYYFNEQGCSNKECEPYFYFNN